MTARVVPLASDAAGDSRVGGSVTERLALVAELSRRAWSLTGQPWPSYTRRTMPVKLTTLADQKQLAAHGLPRATVDIDIWIEPTPENAARVWRALGDFGAPLADLAVDENDLTRPDVVVQFGVPPNRIDFLTGVTGLTFGEAWPHRVDCELEGVGVPVLGRRELIRNKQATGREKDRVDVKGLEGKS